MEDSLRFLTYAREAKFQIFCLRKFDKVGPFCAPNGPYVDFNTTDNSNAALQNDLAFIV